MISGEEGRAKKEQEFRSGEGKRSVARCVAEYPGDGGQNGRNGVENDFEFFFIFEFELFSPTLSSRYPGRKKIGLLSSLLFPCPTSVIPGVEKAMMTFSSSSMGRRMLICLKKKRQSIRNGREGQSSRNLDDIR